MICPTCKIEMIDGYVPISKMVLQFIPNDGGSFPLLSFSIGSNAIQLSKYSFWTATRTKSYYCSKCRIVIIPEYNKEDN